MPRPLKRVVHRLYPRYLENNQMELRVPMESLPFDETLVKSHYSVGDFPPVLSSLPLGSCLEDNIMGELTKFEIQEDQLVLWIKAMGRKSHILNYMVKERPPRITLRIIGQETSIEGGRTIFNSIRYFRLERDR